MPEQQKKQFNNPMFKVSSKKTQQGIDGFVGRVINGDCLEVMRKMPEGSVDAVITDPP